MASTELLVFGKILSHSTVPCKTADFEPLVFNDHLDTIGSGKEKEKYAHENLNIDQTQQQQNYGYIVDVSWDFMFCLQGRNLRSTEPWLKEIMQNLGEINNVSSSWDRITMSTKEGRAFIISKDTKVAERVVYKEKDSEDMTINIHFSSIISGDTHVVALTSDGVAGFVNTEEHPPRFQPFVPHLKVKQVSCGKEHVLLLSKIGVVYSLGIGSRGQLGNDNVDDSPEPQIVQALEPLCIVSIAAGGWHSAAVSDIGDVYTWGWNETGQLGLPCQNLKTADNQEDKHYVNVQCFPRVLDISSTDGKDVNVVSVSCGARHTALLTDRGEVFTSGWNKYGQLGHDDKRSRDAFTKIPFFDGKEVKATHVHCGGWSTIVETEKDTGCLKEQEDAVT